MTATLVGHNGYFWATWAKFCKDDTCTDMGYTATEQEARDAIAFLLRDPGYHCSIVGPDGTVIVATTKGIR